MAQNIRNYLLVISQKSHSDYFHTINLPFCKLKSPLATVGMFTVVTPSCIHKKETVLTNWRTVYMETSKVIAISGTSGAGESTLTKKLGERDDANV